MGIQSMNNHLVSRRSGGFTLIELMVAVTIGLLLTLVVANLFLSSRATYQTTDEMSRMQENIRYAYQLLTRTVHLSGFRSSPNTYASTIFPAGTQAITGTDGGGTASDSFTVRYQGSGTGTGTGADGSVVDCQGGEVDAGVMATATFSIGAGTNGTALLCNNGTSTVEVVPDVDNMQLLYGEDTNGDMVADRYVAAGSVTNFDNVVTVRAALLFRTTNISAAAVRDTGTYTLNGTVIPAFNDTRIRKAVVINLNLRNRTP
jgi:type IV pilus assembly protein PilW